MLEKRKLFSRIAALEKRVEALEQEAHSEGWAETQEAIKHESQMEALLRYDGTERKEGTE